MTRAQTPRTIKPGLSGGKKKTPVREIGAGIVPKGQKAPEKPKQAGKPRRRE